MGGLFVETEKASDVDATIRIDFLVQEGQIRAAALVRHVKPGSGLGLKFRALPEEERPSSDSLDDQTSGVCHSPAPTRNESGRPISLVVVRCIVWKRTWRNASTYAAVVKTDRTRAPVAFTPWVRQTKRECVGN